MSGRSPHTSDRAWILCALSAAVVGLLLMADSLGRSSATYDEVAYLRVASRWWRGGGQESITRMGSPLTFWKLQQAPTLWILDRTGHGAWIDEPELSQSRLLPCLRMGSLWIWALALALTAMWALRLHGPRAMAMAAWLFALSPNLLAHGTLITMELPLVATSTAVGLCFTISLTARGNTTSPDLSRTSGARFFWFSAVAAGVAFSCKVTAILIPPILGLCWLIRDLNGRSASPWPVFVRVTRGMIAFLAVMFLSDWIVTGFAVLPISERIGEHPTLAASPPAFRTLVEWPVPQDWVGFLTQMRHQRSGGPSYLLGERRMTGWWYYYLVAMAVKVPPSVWLLVVGRLLIGRKGDGLLVVAIATFLAITAAGSSRNYGFRYLLPIAPLAIVWLSALAEAGRWARACAIVGIVGQALAVATIHPYELSYFPAYAGGPRGGRRILADSNLDWGQGLRGLARLQREEPRFRDLSVYYFGDTRPEFYGVSGECHVVDAGTLQPDLSARFAPKTEYVAVSSSLQFGPWGPGKHFRRLDGVRPVRVLEDATMAIYATADLRPDQ